MADPVGSLKQIVEVALKIKEAVETVRQNKEQCLRIGKRAIRVSDILSQLENTEMTNNPAMSAALEELDETLRRAHTLVTACQEKNIVCLFCTATKLSKQLRRVKDDISEHLMEGIFATNVQVTIILTRIQDDDAHPPPPKDTGLARSQQLGQTPMRLRPSKKKKQARRRRPQPPMPLPFPLPCSLPFQNAEDLAGIMSIPLSGPSDEDEGYAVASSAAAYEGYEMAGEENNVPKGSEMPSPPLSMAISFDAFEGYEMAGEENNVPKGSEMPSPPLSMASSFDAYEGYEMAGEENNVPTGSEMSSPPSSSLIEFTLTELEVATDHFSTIVGQGGFATVYKGVLRDRLVVAIKKLDVKKLAKVFPSSDDEEPINHPFVRLCSMLEHKNIVRLLGYCDESREEHMPNEDAPTGFVQVNEEFPLLVEEYMPNGTLSNVIYGSQLDWSSRFRIIQGITDGVIYLHTHSEEPIVHLDLKPDNILLDSDMNPKIGDFESARILDEDDHKMAIVCGTLGYMPPEYIVEGVISVKNDVYGFGVTLLETISGMRRSGPAVRRQASIEWAWKVHQAGAMHELFDPLLCDQSQLKEIKRCMAIGLLCTQKKPTDRPTMPDVLEMLNGKKKLPTPKLPGYIKHVLRGKVQ